MREHPRSIRRNPRARGTAAVEFAIVLPVLLLLVLGIIDWGYFFFLENTVVNAAREGARAASVAVGTEATIRQRALDTVAASLQAGALGEPPTSVEFLMQDDAICQTAGTCFVSVEVVYPAGSLTGASIVPVPANAWGKSEMRR